MATHGRHDEEALERALSTKAPYIGLISSRKRATAIFAFLKTKGITQQDWDRVKTPAGLDIGAKTPEEIAVSILAEIVEHRRNGDAVEMDSPTDALAHSNEEAIDPICGMTVKIETAKFTTKFDGRDYFFCCAACLQKFEATPKEYA